MDFRVKIKKLKNGISLCDLYIIEGGTTQCIQQDLVLEKRHRELLRISQDDDIHDCIVECKWFGKRWEPIKLRFDKPLPNNRKTLQKTIQNIQENIALKEVLDAFSSFHQ